eukprot:SAG31_NODE_4619_length_3091_cov_2.016711_1_plen_43_part_10
MLAEKTFITAHSATGVGHVMISYMWDHQPLVLRINAALKRRNY